jgi:glutathione S-transferase
MGQCASPPAMAADATGNVEIYGMPISGNVIPCVTLVLDLGVGNLVFKDMMKGELKAPDMLAVNPWGQMPSMKDGSFCLAESGAILRYIGNAYALQKYGGFDAKARGDIDWALDWIGTSFAKNYANLWYPVAGFGPEPADKKKASADANENLEKFEKKFLAGGKKFMGGDSMSIADYKLGCWLWYLDHPAVQKKMEYELSPRFKQYVKDYLGALSDKSKDFLNAGKSFMDGQA